MKKILSILLSLSVLAGSAVAVSAEEYVNEGSYGEHPFYTFEAIEIEPEVYEYAMMEAVPDGATAYQLSIDVINLPDLTWARSGGGTRIGTLNVTLYCDITKLVKIQTMNTVEKTEAWLGDYAGETYKYGCMAITSDNAAINGINNSISVSKACTSATDGFPTVTGDAALDADGVLEDAIILWVVATEPVEITKMDGTVIINNGSLLDYDSYQSNGVASGYVIGGTAGDEGGETVTPVAMDAGVEVAEGPYAGMTSVSAPEAVEVDAITNITVANDKDASKTLSWTAPTAFGDGKTKVLPILVFDETANADSTFTITLWNAETAVKIFTHAVEALQ